MSDDTTKAPNWVIPQSGEFTEFSERYLALADPAARKVIEEFRLHIPVEHPALTAVFSEAEKLITGGKKLRGAFVALGFSIAVGEPHLYSDVIDASIGYEFLHNAFLVHDDIMDRGFVRRGKTSAWVALGSLANGLHEQEGIAQAINLGDMVAYWLPEILASRHFPPRRVQRAIGILSRTVQTTVAGQILDVNSTVNALTQSEDAMLSIALYKTALYSFVAPLHIGMALGRASAATRFDACHQFGVPIGIAFQLQDDILGLYSTEAELGKSVTSDLVEAKKTILFQEIYNRLDATDKEQFLSIYHAGQVTETELEWVKGAGIQTGALQAVESRARSLITEGRMFIPRISSDLRIRNLLYDISDFVLNRKF